MQLILVDDDPISRRFLSAQLRALGYSVAEYEDGQDAWEALQHTLVPLVISDWQMPGLDGPGLIQRIRAAELPAYVYCILLTSPGELSDRMLGLEAGADDYLTRPVAADDLQARLSIASRILRLEQELHAGQGVKTMLSNQLRQLSTTDTLTGLRSRPAILAELNEQLAHANQQGSPLSVASIHLEELKAINSAHGYTTGDTALRHVARMLQSEQQISIGRWSDATFLAVLPNHSTESAERLAQLWQQLIVSEPLLLANNQHLPITVQIQVAAPNKPSISAEQLIEGITPGH